MNLKLFPLDWQTCSLAMASCKFKCTNYLNYLTKHSTNDLCTALNESLYKKKKQIVKTRDIVAISTEELINVLVLHIFSLFLLSLLFFFFFHLRVVNFSFFFLLGVPFVRWFMVVCIAVAFDLRHDTEKEEEDAHSLSLSPTHPSTARRQFSLLYSLR